LSLLDFIFVIIVLIRGEFTPLFFIDIGK